MWHVQLTKRDFFEVCMGGVDPNKIGARQTAAITIGNGITSDIDVYWLEDPAIVYGYPTLVIVPDGEEVEILTALNSGPSTPSPFTALSKFFTRSEAHAYFGASLRPVNQALLSATVALSIVEAVIYSENKVNIRTVTPAACKRTVSYAWGKAVAAGIPSSSLDQIATRWAQAYSFVNNIPGAVENIYHNISPLIGILNVGIQIGDGLDPSEPAALMAHAILSESDSLKESAWKQLRSSLGLSVSLAELSNGSREQRGTYLQHGLQKAADADRNSTIIPACAFLATQVGPGSLEHLEILRALKSSELVLWYAFYAALQYPIATLFTQNSLGFRVLRDVKKVEEHFAAPTFDISFNELKVIARLGVDNVARKLGHAAEIEVEIVPLVVSSFPYQSSATKTVLKESPRDSQLTIDHLLPNPQKASLSPREQINRALDLISTLLNDIPEPLESPQAPTKKPTRKKI